MKKLAEEIFRAGLAAVLPGKLIREQMSVRDAVLKIGGLALDLRPIKNIYVVGAGKASAVMAKEMEALLGDRIAEGHIVVKYGHGCGLKHIQLTEAGHPTPDANGVHGAAEILRIAKRAAEGDLVLCLLSGGGSALMADYPDGAQLPDLIKLNQLLVGCGADIAGINAVRKHLSKMKGGRLAQAAWPARLLTLVLSDVIGDPLDVIASGPTAPDPSTFADALDIVRKFGLAPDMPGALLKHLEAGAEGRIAETPKIGDPIFERTQNVIIGNNRMALQAGLTKAIGLGFDARIVNTPLTGDARVMGREIIKVALALRRSPTIMKDVCLLLGGETTVKVGAPGLGGRNQHLALAAAIELADKSGITLLSAGTDGSDGPTDAAGAVVDCQTASGARAMGMEPNRYLNEFDSYHFFKAVGGHVVTGPTLTNVMDMVVVLVEKSHPGVVVIP